MMRGWGKAVAIPKTTRKCLAERQGARESMQPKEMPDIPAAIRQSN
jgi:hypothetical protein